MSDMLTHWAVFDDCRRLMAVDAAMAPDFLSAIEADIDMARLGALTRGGNEWVPAILRQCRAERDASAISERHASRLAFALGGITHYAADVVLKPLMSERAGRDWSSAHVAMEKGGKRRDAPSVREVSAYYDTKVFREVYGAGKERPFSPLMMMDASTDPAQAAEAFVRSLFQRALLSSHTLSPDRAEPLGWVDALRERMQRLYVGIDLYVRVFTSPDPAKVVAFGVDDVFYIPGDPIVGAARRIQAGSVVAQGDLDRALADKANAGAYGRAVALGMNTLREAARFWRCEVDEPPAVRQGE